MSLAQAADPTFQDYRGRLGGQPIGMSLAFRDGHLLPGSHYFYDRYLTDIPLSGAAGSSLDLVEPGLGRFELHWVDRAHRPVAHADDSTGLEGDWTDGGRRLKVSLAMTGAQAYLPGRRYSEVTSAGDAAFEAIVRGFTTAALAGARAKAARLVSYPLRVNRPPGPPVMIRDAASLEAHWDQVFGPAWLKALSADVPHDLFVRDGRAMMADGLAWFDARGLSIVNPPG